MVGTRLFVYGTLRQGGASHRLLAGAHLEKTCRTAPSFTLVSLGEYPALVRGGVTAVVGEVCWVTDALLSRLDAYEDHPELYERGEIPLDDGSTAVAYLLEASRAEGLPTIASGDWLRPR